MHGNVSGELRVTLGHDFIEGYAGAERTLEAIASVFPSAPVWAIAGSRPVAERMGVADRFHTLLPDSERLLRHHRALMPLYPFIVRSRRLPAADVLITSSYAFATGLRTANDAPQLCYCHTPARFAWSMTAEYGEMIPGGATSDQVLRLTTIPIRRIDRRRARSVTRFIANSEHVARQIRDFYGRRSTLIPPPVDTRTFHPAGDHEDYFLLCGRLIEPYKRPTIVIEALSRLGRRLIVAGDGPALDDLRRRAGRSVEFAGALADEELVPLMQRCAALIFPSRDDFGLAPVEAMACGRPVLAFRSGGATETVLPGKTGEFFDDQSADAIADAVRRFDPAAYDPARIRAHAERFGRDRFEAAIEREARATAEGVRL